MPAKPKPNDKPEPQSNDVETEQGFGTGLRAQRQRGRDGGGEVSAELNGQKMDTPLVRVDLYASPPPAAAEAASAAADEGEMLELRSELETLRGELTDASKREQELRTALADQVEAYERRLTEESDVSRQATLLDDRGARITTLETELREREARLVAERRELDT